MFGIKTLFKKRTAEQPERRIEFFKKKFKKAQQKRVRVQERKQRLKAYVERAGFEISIKRLNRVFFNIAIGVNLVVSAFLIYYFSVAYGITWGTIVASMVVLWFCIFVLLIIAMWVVFYLAVDLKIFKRKVDIEEVSKRFENNLRTAVILGPHMVEFELGNLYYEYESMVDIIRDHLNRQGVQIIENSPNRAGHNVAKIYELIDPAQVAVGILADDEVSDYESINSVISYLIGYAMAKGNKILVFQRLPCKKSMLDLYGLTRFVKGADDLNLVFSKLMPNLITDKIPRSYLGPLD